MLPVSVIIPTYNCQQYLADAISSAIAQNPHEVIVIDDGSTDATSDLISTISHPCLNYVQQSNQGVSAARNHGIRLAQSDLIAFLDADDWYLPHRLAQQVALFDSDPELGIVQSGWQRVTATGKLLTEIKPWESAPKLTLETWLRYKPILPSALMIKRTWLHRVGGFDPQLAAAEDIELVCRLALQGCRSTWLREIGVNYRQRSDSAMGNGLIQARDMTKFLDKFFQCSDLPESVQLLEKSTRYYTTVWIAWYLYHTQNLQQMAQFLRVAWLHTPYLPLETLTHWVQSFAQFSNDWGKPLDMQALAQSQEWQELVRWLIAQSE